MSLIRQISKDFSLSFDLVRRGGGKELGSILRTRVWGSQEALGLARDMSLPFPAPEAAIPISIRPIRSDDVQSLLDLAEPGISAAEYKHRVTRRDLLDAGFTSCYVAATSTDVPCFMQWLISKDDIAPLSRALDGQFPPLAADEMIVEGAFTPTAFRGQRIMPAAMALLAEHAAALGARRVVTFVGLPNTPSLKGCERAGFVPYMNRHAVYRLGVRRIHFHPLP